jgi:hypothetical protein
MNSYRRISAPFDPSFRQTGSVTVVHGEEPMSALSVARDERLGAQVVHLPVRRRRPPLPVFGLLGWIIAAAGVYSIGFLSHGLLRGISPALLGVAKIAFIIAIGATFACAARGFSPELIVVTGLCWLILSIAADFVATIRSLDPAVRLLGDPSVVPRNLRDLAILVWLASPALFARPAVGSVRKRPFHRLDLAARSVAVRPGDERARWQR